MLISHAKVSSDTASEKSISSRKYVSLEGGRKETIVWEAAGGRPCTLSLAES
jgi:hypothetical protein